MKKLLWAVLFFSLSACQLVGQEPTQDFSDLETQQAISAEIATVVFETQTASEEQTRTAPTPTFTPGTLPLAEAILAGSQLNDLVDIWPEVASGELRPEDNPLCLEDCITRLWVSADGTAALRISLYAAASRDQAVTLLREVVQSDLGAGLSELLVPGITDLPPETVIVENPAAAEPYVLRTRHGRVIIEASLSFETMGQEQNLLFLSLYTERQIEALRSSG